VENQEFVNLETERVLLRKFKESDTEAFFTYRTKPEVALYQGESWDNYTIEQAGAFVKEQMNFVPGIPDTWFQIAIEEKNTGTLIGDCAIHTLPDINQVEIGYTLDPRYQNKGYAIETVSCLIDYLFNDLKMHRIIAITDVRNQKSAHLLEKLGMRREGHFIKNIFFRGQYADEYLYALLKEEYEA
jgi:RimJ/RimL family protein N-acetyltransferase